MPAPQNSRQGKGAMRNDVEPFVGGAFLPMTAHRLSLPRARAGFGFAHRPALSKALCL